MSKGYILPVLVFVMMMVCTPESNGIAASRSLGNTTPKKHITYCEITGGYQWGVAKGSEHSTREAVACGYQLHGPLFLQTEAGHCHFKLKDASSRTQADGVIINFLLRWHVVDSRYLTFFTEGGIGVVSCNRNIPSEGMETNTAPQAGVGVIIPLWHQTRFVLGGRYVHLSHGLWKPHINNPGFNSAGLYAGLHILF
ncbi:MAG: acyloxyacyl hydrolase [Desulfoplanes sp.]|nr:acyloxyacyl hydrolase [Desulfoplanes sp.]